MKRILPLAVLLLALPAFGERIQDYLVQIAIEPTGYVVVTEELRVTFDLPRHGIYRRIPYSYTLPTGEVYKLRIWVEEVLADGVEVPVKEYREGGYLVLRIGDPARLVQGQVVYTIRYRVARALRSYGDEVELFWNAIGTEWELPISRAEVTVILPPGAPEGEVRVVGYQGGWGSRTPFELTPSPQGLTGQAEGLAPGEGVTLAVRFPARYVRLPGIGTSILWFLQDNLYAGIPFLVLIGMFVLWWKRGRDPKPGTIAPMFSPPEDVGPAEAGVLIDDRFDPRDLSAGIVGLAGKGHLVIHELWEDERGKAPDDFELERTDSRAPLTRFEEALLEALFSTGERVRLSQLKYKFYEKLQGLGAQLYMDLTEKGFYAGNPDRVRSLYRGLGIGIAAFGIAMGVLAQSLYLGAALAASGLIALLFAPIMPRKTGKGIRVLRDILGLEEYIRRAEVERVEFAAAEKHFEELLPYAMAFGLTEVWTRAFEGLLTRPPNWYDGRFPTFAPYYLGWRLSAFHYAARTAATTAPRSSRGWSGGSGFGGGGFSGGGMGGGGGGTW